MKFILFIAFFMHVITVILHFVAGGLFYLR
jgi:hypothetical protein